MAADATWFGPRDRPLAGWLHVPDSRLVRGGVVVCPPLGLEYVPSHRTIRTLSERLCAQGFAVLRFDWDGTGDSAGSLEDPHRLAALTASVGWAVRELHGVVGGAPIAVLGLRLGATLAAQFVRESDEESLVRALVLWDPCVSGRRFMRQQAALGRLVGCDDAADGSVDAPGFQYPSETVKELGTLDLTSMGPLSVPDLLVLRRPTDQGVPLFVDHPGAQRDTVVGMPELLDVLSPHATVPHAAVERCVDWLDRAMPTVTTSANPGWRAEAVLEDGVRERHVRLGPLGLTGVETRPPDGVPMNREVLLLNNAAESHIGPVRLWTELARRWAPLGIASTRFDLSGIGDSPTRAECLDDVMYASYAPDDLRSVLDARSDAGKPPILVGLCSGGHLALQVGGALPGGVVVALNVMTTGPVHPYGVGPAAVVDQVWSWPRRTLRLLGVAPEVAQPLIRRIEAQGVRTPAAMQRVLLSLMWRLLVTLRMAISPGAGLAAVRGVDASLVCGMDDAVGYLSRGQRDLARARRQGLEFVAVPDLDHVPMPARQRHLVKGLVTQQVLRRATRTASPGSPGIQERRPPSGVSSGVSQPTAGCMHAVPVAGDSRG